MMRFFILLAVLAWAPDALACRGSTGETKKDEAVAAKMCKANKGTEDILLMSVGGPILYVDVTRRFHAAMKADRISATKLVQVWMRAMRQETGSRSVSVLVYVDSVKVVAGETTLLSGDVVEFLL